MKKWFVAAALSVVLFCGTVFGDANITATWNPNAVSDQVVGYRIYDNGVEVADTALTTATFQVADGNHSFTVTAYNVNGESGHTAPINKVIYTAVPGTPSNIIITIIIPQVP